MISAEDIELEDTWARATIQRPLEGALGLGKKLYSGAGPISWESLRWFFSGFDCVRVDLPGCLQLQIVNQRRKLISMACLLCLLLVCLHPRHPRKWAYSVHLAHKETKAQRGEITPPTSPASQWLTGSWIPGPTDSEAPSSARLDTPGIQIPHPHHSQDCVLLLSSCLQKGRLYLYCAWWTLTAVHFSKYILLKPKDLCAVFAF